MAGRGGDKKDEGPVRRPRRSEPEAPQHQDAEKETAVPEQEVYGNTFLLHTMGGDRNMGAPPADAGGLDLDVLQEFGGIEDADPAPIRPPMEDGGWFRPRFRRKGGEEVEPMGPEAPPEPGIPPEDADWLDGLEPEGEPWADPAPQPPATALEAGLRHWLRALFPLSGSLASQLAIATVLAEDATLQHPSGEPLLGTAAAAALGSSVAWTAGAHPHGRRRLQRGLAIVASPAAPRDPARTAAQLAGLTEPGPLPQLPPDPWLGRLVVARIGLDSPPVPQLDDPPTPVPDNDAVLAYEDLLRAELGAPPDPKDALRGAALEGCEAQARWAVALRAGAATCALALVDNGSDPGPVGAVLQRCDTLVGQAVALLQEIASAARKVQVPIRGLRNGLARTASLLSNAHRALVQGLASAGLIPDAHGDRPAPIDPRLEGALRDGRPLPQIDEALTADHADLLDAFAALGRSDHSAAIASGRSVATRAQGRQDGIGMAAGTLIEVQALHDAGRTAEAQLLRREVGGRLVGAGSRSALSLLARWQPDAPDHAPAG